MTQNLTLRKNNLRLAITAILFGVFIASLSDAFIKLVSADFQLWQVFLLRSLISIPLLVLAIKIHTPGTGLFPNKTGWTAIRSLLLVLMWIALYAALPMVELSVAGAAYYTLPLFITLFSAVFVGEYVNAKSWMAIAVGFVGVLLILKPNAADFNPFALLPLASAIFYAIAMIITRTKIRNESALVLSLSLNMAFAAIGALGSLILVSLKSYSVDLSENAFLFGEWVALDSRGWLIIAALALLITIGSQCATIAYQNGPSSTVSSFDFFYLAFVAMWGFFFFGEIPDIATMAGAILIACAGVCVVRN